MKINTLIVGLVISTNLFAQFPEFEMHKIGEHGDRMAQTALIDLDEDGDLDWVFGNRGKMWWYEYKTSDTWILHDLGEGAQTDVGGCAADINRDGKTDFMVGDGWYENTGNARESTFKFHYKNTLYSHDNVMADIDGDGIDDVVANSNHEKNPHLVWYRIPADYTAKWEKTIVSEGIHGGVDPKGVADLDNDGDNDIVRGNSWFENISGDGKNWKEHPVFIPEGGSRTGPYGLALKAWCIDLDGDGDQDVIEAECDIDDTRIFWWENTNEGQDFVYHLISENSTRQDFHSLAVADFDGDGDADVFSGGGPMTQGTHKWFIWENVNGKHWKEHVILEGYRCHEAKAADVDGDGDIDICSKPWHGNVHVFLENKRLK